MSLVLLPLLLIPLLLILLPLFLLCFRKRKFSPLPIPPPPLSTPRTLLIILGSGGHTAEMLTLISDLFHTPLFTHHPPTLIYVTTATDTHSAARARRLHTQATLPTLHNASYTIHTLPRAREVGQSYPSSVLTTLRCLTKAWRMVRQSQPDLVLTNGPATGAVVAFVAKLHCAKVIYVESLARVQTLSLSGKLLYPICDRFLVQWPELASRLKKAEYYGRLS